MSSGLLSLSVSELWTKPFRQNFALLYSESELPESLLRLSDTERVGAQQPGVVTVAAQSVRLSPYPGHRVTGDVLLGTVK